MGPLKLLLLLRLEEQPWSLWRLAVLVLAVLAGSASFSGAQQLDDCPDNWFEYGGHCYDFNTFSTKTYQEATIFCLQDYASLVSINSQGEHNFIQTWLNKFDSARQEWFTSGYRDITDKLIWESDGSEITLDYFPSPAVRNEKKTFPNTDIQYNQIVYTYIESLKEYRWSWGRVMKTGPFICEISKQDTWQFYQQKRDFSFGTGITDPNQWETGPNITFQSQDTVFFESRGVMTTVVLDCQASGNPRPDYRWFRQTSSNQNKEGITSALGNRYTVTNGRLTIENPDKITDSSSYTCVASNKLGTVLSNPIQISYGYLVQFSNVPPSPITAIQYMGEEITCQAPDTNTDLHFNWFKRNVFNFVRPELNQQYFISKKGSLYISEVQYSDEDTYFCAVFMAPKSGQVLASLQPPSMNSMGINVTVVAENAKNYGPDIHNSFPQTFPSQPMVGEQVEIECLAYGRLPLYYSWVREGAPLHPEAYLRDHNRVLTIPKARLEDTGPYTCIVRREGNSANKTIYLNLKARPSFPFPLNNQHVDAGSKVTWTCNAIGVPRPTYTWYRNGEKLITNVASRTTVNRNILTIDNVEASKHDGMYQCQASNMHGFALSSAQLRALLFAPTFATTPVESSKQAAEGGNVTIACRPQAAPRAQIKWLRNEQEVGKVLPNGNLELSILKLSDDGVYTCVATNTLGEARSSCTLVVQKGAVFTAVPPDVVVVQNETAALPCTASFDKSKTDIIYSWMFNSHVLDFTGMTEENAHYSMPHAQSQDSGMLYIIGAQFRHEGEYTCMVSTVTGSIRTSAYLTVKGPPWEPGGVHVRTLKTGSLVYDNIELWWQDVNNNGKTVTQHSYPVTKYTIEYQSIYDDHWNILREDIPAQEVVIQEFPEWCGYKITEGLSPGTSYYFRVRAGNSQTGYGLPSAGPYVAYTMAPAPPVHAPSNIGGGGGSVGELKITWDAMPRSLWGGDNLRYQVYYRQKSLNAKWEASPQTTKTIFTTVVGQPYYYLPYEVKVQSINDKGSGPNSTIVIVYSAEDMPTNIAPTFIQAIAVNGTAAIVEWEPVPNTRESAKGTVFAYQINYWKEGDTRCLGKYEDTALFIRFYGDVSSGLLIGMDYGDDYCLNLQFLNHAGLGPKTDNYYVGMNDAPPHLYPEFVTVMSNGNESVRLLWRGVSVFFGEEPIRGYKAWWWDIREDIRTAKITDFGKTSTGVIHGVEKDVMYKLRMLGYSIGGDGKKSQDVFFTLGGLVMYDPVTTEIMNAATVLQTTLIIPLCCLMISSLAMRL